MKGLDAVDDEQRPERGVGVVSVEHELHVGARHGEGDGRVALTPDLGAAEVVAAQGYELIVIAAVVIGGTSLFGGEGSVLGTLVGTLLIGVLNSGLAINNVNPYYQPIIIGTIVVFSVYLDQLAKRRRRT